MQHNIRSSSSSGNVGIVSLGGGSSGDLSGGGVSSAGGGSVVCINAGGATTLSKSSLTPADVLMTAGTLGSGASSLRGSRVLGSSDTNVVGIPDELEGMETLLQHNFN